MKDFRPVPDGVRLALSGIGHGYGGRAGARRRVARAPRRRGDLPARAFRLRQVDAAAHRGRGRAAGRGQRARSAAASVSDDARHVPPEGRGVGLIFQDFALFPHLTVARNVAFGLSGAAGGARRSGCATLLERVGMARHGEKYPHQLSGGEQQRVALARALAPRPPILLMDEPFSGLDNRLRDGIRDETLDDPQGGGGGGAARHPRAGRGDAHGRRDRADARRADRAAGRALQHLQQPGRPRRGAVLLRRQRHPRGGGGLRHRYAVRAVPRPRASPTGPTSRSSSARST